MKHLFFSTLCTGILMLLVAAFGSPVNAEVHEGSMNVEIFAGELDPGPDLLDSETNFGLRYGYDISRRLGFQFELWRYETDDSFTSGMTTASFDLDLNGIEISVYGFFVPEGRVTLFLFGGIGGIFATLDADISNPIFSASLRNAQDDSFTAHGGGGLRIQLGEHVYLRPDVRFRWIEQRDDDEIDTAYSLAIGFNFGGGY